MKLFNRVLSRLLASIAVVLPIWAVLFYYAMLNEITDEIDDSLEDYSEMIIIRSLTGEDLPSNDSGSNNQYFIKGITPQEALSRPPITYKDSMIYIIAKRETEPARILTTIFKDGNGNWFQLEVSTPTIEKHDLKESLLYMILALFGILLLTFLLINILIFKRSMQPFYKLLEWLGSNRPGSGNTNPNIETNTTEFKHLNEAVAKYARHSEELFEHQKQFIGNASHEIQTPIAVCTSRIEMLMEDESLTQKQLEELMKTHQTLEYVSKLNKSLLLLSKIDNNQFCSTTDVDMNRIINNLTEDYQEVYAYKNLEIEVIEKGKFILNINENLSGILINNLLKNACEHNIQGGKVEIICTGESLEFRNTASAGPLDASRIFERFYKMQNKESSSGLGLAIASAVCRQFSLQLQYRWDEGWHSFFLKN